MRRPWALAGLLLAAYLAQNLWAGSHPWFPDAMDEGLNNEYAIKTGELLAAMVRGEAPDDWLTRLTWQGFPYGPLVYVLGGGLDAAFGPAPWIRLIAVQLGLLLGLLATFGIARRITGRREAGFWAMALLAGVPMVLFYGRHFTTDTWVLGLSAASCWAAIRTRGYQDIKATLLLGLLLGTGLLVKPVVLHMAFGPLVFYGLITTIGGRRFPGEEAAPSGGNAAARLLKAAPALLAGAVLSLAVGMIYARHLLWGRGAREIETFGLGPTRIWGIVPFEAYPRVEGWGFVDWLVFYPRMLVQYQVGALLLIVLLLGAALALRRRIPGAIWVLLAFLAGQLFFTSLGAKKWYYTLPTLPFLAILAGMGLDSLVRDSRARVAGLAAVLLGSFLAVGFSDRPGLVWNRPWMLQVAPGPATPDMDAVARDLGQDGSLIVISTEVLKRAHGRELAVINATLHKLEVAGHRQGASWTINPVETRDQLECHMVPPPEAEEDDAPCDEATHALYIGRSPGRWVTDAVLANWPDFGEAEWHDQEIIGGELRQDADPQEQERFDQMAKGWDSLLETQQELRVGDWYVTLSRIRAGGR